LRIEDCGHSMAGTRSISLGTTLRRPHRRTETPFPRARRPRRHSEYASQRASGGPPGEEAQSQRLGMPGSVAIDAMGPSRWLPSVAGRSSNR
jgi:hypothetical protein